MLYIFITLRSYSNKINSLLFLFKCTIQDLYSITFELYCTMFDCMMYGSHILDVWYIFYYTIMSLPDQIPYNILIPKIWNRISIISIELIIIELTSFINYNPII